MRGVTANLRWQIKRRSMMVRMIGQSRFPERGGGGRGPGPLVWGGLSFEDATGMLLLFWMV
jgi:hypothetical protein